MARYRRLWDTYRFPGFRPQHTVSGIFGDPKARVIRLVRRGKKRLVECAALFITFYDRKTRRVRDLSCGDVRIYLEVEIRRVYCRRCKRVKQERLDWLADNPFYTKRFAFYVGRRCRDSAIQGCGQGTASGLEDGEGSGKAIHARAVEASGTAWAEGDWYRRNLYPQGSYVPDCGQ